MARFVSIHRGRFHVHTLSTPQFRTRYIDIKLARPLSRSTVTATAMLPYLWMEGTKTYPDMKALLRRSDDLYGAVVRTGAGKRADRQVVEAYTSVPEESALSGAQGLFTQALGLLTEVVTAPATDGSGFLPQHVAREKTLHKKRIESIFDDKIQYAMERCLEAMCSGEPHGLARLGYLEDVDPLDGARLWDEHRRLLSEAQVHVYTVGDFGDGHATAQDVLAQLEASFAAAGIPPTREGEGAGERVAALPYRSGEVRNVTDRQPVNQGKLNLGFRTGISYSSPDYPALVVCNAILGGFPTSKLFLNVREKASLAYYASSRLDGLSGILAVQTGIDIQKYEQALDIILQQVQQMQDGAFTEQEMSFAKRGLRNQFLQLGDQPMSLADVHFSGVLAGVHREVDDLLAQIEQVTRDDVVRAAQALRLDTVYFLRNPEEGARDAGNSL